MLELPIRACYNGIVKMLGGDSRSAKDKGLETNWMDFEKRWSITLQGKMLVRGRCNMERLEAEIHVSLAELQYEAAVELEQSIKQYEKTDRYGSLLEIICSKAERFADGEIWGRTRRKT